MNLLFAPKISNLKERDKNTKKSFSSQAACVTIAALMQYFLMAAFCWMLIEGIYLYLFVVKVYNINTKMYMYHVISWGEFFIFFQTCTAYCNNAFGSPNLVFSCSKVLDFFPFFMGRSSSNHGGHFTRHRCWERRITKLYE